MNKKDRQKRFEALADHGCMICRRPAQIHHLIGKDYRGMGQKAGDEYTIPLCMDHHTGENGIHQIGKVTWERRYGAQAIMLAHINEVIECD